MSGLITGLNLANVGQRLDAAGLHGEDRARAMELMMGIEMGVLFAVTARAKQEQE